MNVTEHPAPPYAADVRAKGWRFEIDYERVEQSDTWALAPPEARPWLLMLWLTAWRQTPCGSLPADDDLIAARIGMPPKVYAKHRDVLRRGWWVASDGRLYHDFIVSMVEAMVAMKHKERDRKADWRGRKEKERLNLSRGCPTGQTRDGHVSDDTGTGTGTGITVIPPLTELRARPVGDESAKPTKAGEVCRAIKAKGIPDVNPSNPALLAYIDKGVPVAVFEEAADVCRKLTPPKGMKYLLGIVKREVEDAAAIAAGPSMQAGAWDANRSSIEAKAAELGIPPWNENDLSASREMFPAYTARVRACVEAARGQR